MERPRPRKIEKRLVDRHRLNERCHFGHEDADRSGDSGIFRHVGTDDHRLRTGTQRLEHGHRGPDAVGARDIACGQDDTAPSTSDDHGPIPEFGLVAFLDRRVKRVAIDVRDREIVEFGMGYQAR